LRPVAIPRLARSNGNFGESIGVSDAGPTTGDGLLSLSLSLHLSRAGTFRSITAAAKLNFLRGMAARLRAARKLGLNRCGRRNSKPQPLMKRTALSPKDSPLPRRWSAKLSRNCNHLLSLASCGARKEKERERGGEERRSVSS